MQHECQVNQFTVHREFQSIFILVQVKLFKFTRNINVNINLIKYINVILI